MSKAWSERRGGGDGEGTLTWHCMAEEAAAAAAAAGARKGRERERKGGRKEGQKRLWNHKDEF